MRHRLSNWIAGLATVALVVLIFLAVLGPTPLPPSPPLPAAPTLSTVHHVPVRLLTSWYGPGFHGRLTANGERFNKHALTAAHRTLPFNTLLRLTNPANGRTLVVRINDRGPYKEFAGVVYFEGAGRDLDISERAAELLGTKEKGVTWLWIEVVDLPEGYETHGAAGSLQVRPVRPANRKTV